MYCGISTSFLSDLKLVILTWNFQVGIGSSSRHAASYQIFVNMQTLSYKHSAEPENADRA